MERETVVAAVALAALALVPSFASAGGPNLAVYIGPSAGGGPQLVPSVAVPPPCSRCPAVRSGARAEEPDTDQPPLATIAVALVGSEGKLRAGGEVFTILGLADRSTTGFTSFVTYAGLDQGRAFAQAGLGIGTFWGGQRDESGLELLAGSAHAELGVRITPRVILLGRGDLLVSSEAATPVASIGLQWIPGAPSHVARAYKPLRLED